MSQHPAPPPDRSQPPPPEPAEVSTRPVQWMERVEAGVRFLVRLYLGILMTALPWLDFWTQNNLFTYSRTLMMLSDSGFVRGLVSGLGLLNVLLALLEIRALRPPRSLRDV